MFVMKFISMPRRVTGVILRLLNLLGQVVQVLISRLLNRRIVFIMGSPLHTNIGDLAINWAESSFIEKHLEGAVCYSVPLERASKYTHVYTWLIADKDLLLGIGGGNMGDMYIVEEEWRRKLVRLFPRNKIVIFPQTIHFRSSPLGRAELKKTINAYTAHPDLTLVARERESYDFMKKKFPGNVVILTPDIVLSMAPRLKKYSRGGALLCIRNDDESTLTDATKNYLYDFMNSEFDEVKFVDTMASHPLFFLIPKRKIVRDKLDEFARAKLVVTDRLHGMVFAAITGTPCIALTNFNHKVKGTYAWIENLPYIYFCDNISQLESAYKMIDMRQAYDYDPAMHDEFWDRISRVIKG